MYTLGTHFEELLRRTQPPQERIDVAATVTPLVRDYLRDHADLATIAPHSRLVGSYAQKMSVGDVKDVDFLVFVPGDPVNNEPEAKSIVRQLRAALDGLPEHLGYKGYAAIDIEMARRSVHVYFENEDFHLDVVPATAIDGLDEPLYVPDRGLNRWIPSHPLGYIELLNSLNNEHGKKVKRLGRLFKHFRDFHMKTRKPKSYWLGAVLVHHVQNTLDTDQSIAVLFHDLVNSTYNSFAPTLGREGATPHIKDPMLGHDISWNWQRSHFETFMRRLADVRDWSAQALEEGDRDRAISLWQKVFGADYFPSEVAEAATQRAQTAYPGKSVVLPSGLVLPSATAAGGHTPTHPTRFYGSDE